MLKSDANRCKKLVLMSVMSCSIMQISNLSQIFLIGFYDEREFSLYVSSISNELKIPVR